MGRSLRASESWCWQAQSGSMSVGDGFASVLGAGPVVLEEAIWGSAPSHQGAWQMGSEKRQRPALGKGFGCSQSREPLGTPMGEHRALDQEGKTTPGVVSGFSHSIPDLCCNHNWGTSGCLPLGTTTPSPTLYYPSTLSPYPKWVGIPW